MTNWVRKYVKMVWISPAGNNMINPRTGFLVKDIIGPDIIPIPGLA